MRYLPLLLLLLACGAEPLPTTDLSKSSVIPLPIEIQATESAFLLDQGISFQGNLDNPEVSAVEAILSEQLGQIDIAISEEDGRSIELHQLEEDDSELGADGYRLIIGEEDIKIEASSSAGLLYGGQTLYQIASQRTENYLPTGTVTDRPNFAYRGFMLDVSRHFFGPETVKQIIDYLTLYKINYLHLHLSDDQGWRLEIKSYPNLTAHGGTTQVGGGEGGFYTQEEYKDLVAYAAERQITLVPEFDMPGHTNSALASYPDLNCDGIARELYTGIDVGFSSFCIHSEYTYEFVDAVLEEVAALTPGPFIHIGGDEVHTLSQEDYNYFIERVSGMVNAHGKRVMGWDEISESVLPAGSVAQYWNFAENAQAAVAQGAQVVFSPATRTYLDMKYDSTTELGLSWAAYIELNDAYEWDPVGMVEGIEAQHILGIEAPLWSETIEEIDDIEYLIFPRLSAISEVGWTPAGLRSWTNFQERVSTHQDMWQSLGIDYYHSPFLE